MSTKPQKLKGRSITPRQRKLVALLPKVKDGTLTKKQAMEKAGYSKKSALQQSNTFGSLRNNARMQQALRDAGFDEVFIAQKIVHGATQLRPGKPQLGYIQTGAELLDVKPATKQINAEGSIDDLIKAQEGGSDASA